jgi:hypothetical protein
MRRTLLFSALALAICAGSAHARGVGVGVFGGVSIPIVNDLSKQGTQFGLRVPVELLPLVTVEPYYSQSGLGDVEESFGGPVTYTRDGGDLKSFGANAMLTFGGPVRFYPFVGIGKFTLERNGSPDVDEMGYNFGLGLGFDIPAVIGLGADVRAELAMIATDETSQKFANITAGLKYNFFKVP